MINAVLTSAALLVASANALGQAIVINKCNYDVHLFNTPASGGGYSEIDQVLSTGGSYMQQWTELSNSQGWSLKLSKSAVMSNIMQYEYTFHNDGIIWYDLSDVNGNPWDGNWEITATGSCTPKQQAYRYATDDAYGMQACPDTASITVTLCSGTSSGGGSSAAPAAPSSSTATSTWAASTSAAAPTSSPAPVSSAVSSPSYSQGHNTWGLVGNKVEVPAGDVVETKATPTTLVTKAVDRGGVTVTHVQTAVVTQYVTATAAAKRHEHHPRHAHHMRA